MRAPRGVRRVIGLLAVLAALGAACSKSATPSATPTQATTPSPSAVSSSASAAGFTLQQGAGGGFVFSPTTFTVKKGQTITVSDVGSAPHTFTISGKGIDLVNNPGQSQTVTINLAPGTYQFICRFHVAQGMKGTLTVTG